MLAELKQRTVIIGNAGSGKSVFAKSLAALTDVPVIDLDTLHWLDDGRGRKRDDDSAKHLVREAAAAPRWIIEGVYGWLAEAATPRATALVWLDLPWPLCLEGLIARGQQRGGTEEDFADLLGWAEAYWHRETSSSFAGHLRLFTNFARTKIRLHDRDEISRLLAQLCASAG